MCGFIFKANQHLQQQCDSEMAIWMSVWEKYLHFQQLCGYNMTTPECVTNILSFILIPFDVKSHKNIQFHEGKCQNHRGQIQTIS